MADNLSGWAALVGCQFPALIGLAVLAATRKHFPLPPFAYGLILLHCWILFLGAHYTYAEVNTFRFIRDLFGWQRNNYDKLGHFAQGFVPAIIARKILLRRSAVIGRGWLNLFVISLCLGFSALYELFEWAVAVITGDSAENFHLRVRLGYAVGYGDGTRGRNSRAARFEQDSRPTIRIARRQVVRGDLIFRNRVERFEPLERFKLACPDLTAESIFSIPLSCFPR